MSLWIAEKAKCKTVLKEENANKIQTFPPGKNLKMNNKEERGGDIKESSSPRHWLSQEVIKIYNDLADTQGV